MTVDARVLVIEDDAKIGPAIVEGLRCEGFSVALSTSGEDGFVRLNEEQFSAIVLDVMLPGRDGLEILRLLRTRGISIPVLILSARDGVDDRLQGFASGTDDYLVKPFAMPELVARLQALMRRGWADVVLNFDVADLELDVVKRQARRGGVEIHLTVREFSILEYLFRNQGRLVSREMLARDVWHEHGRATPLDNVIDVHMARLRKKIDSGQGPKLIHTIRGVGFILDEQAP